MQVLSSTAVQSVADLKAHSKNLSKILEIAHYAFIVSDLETGKQIPHFEIKSSHVLEYLATALGFNTYAGLQAHFNNPKQRISIAPDHIAAVTNRMQTIAKQTAQPEYYDYLAHYFSEYLAKSNILTGTETAAIEQAQILDQYLPLLHYLFVAPFCADMRQVAENSIYFQLTHPNEYQLTTQHRPPLALWIEIAVLNNLIGECADPQALLKNTLLLPVSLFIHGSPRLSQLNSIYELVAANNYIGKQYFDLKRQLFNEDGVEVQSLGSSSAEDKIIKHHQLKFDLGLRLQTILEKYSPHLTKAHAFQGGLPLTYDPYQIKNYLDQAISKVEQANIYEASSHFLNTCRDHLKDLNSVVSTVSTKHLLAARPAQVSEILWRRQVCHYAENLLNAVQFFLKQEVSSKTKLNLKKAYFNSYGFLIIDHADQIEFQMASTQQNLRMGSHEFSIFLNLFINIINIKSENITKPENYHMLAMSYQCYLLLDQLQDIPHFKPLAKALKTPEYAEFYALALRQLDQIESKIEFSVASLQKTVKGQRTDTRIYTLSPTSLSDATLLLYSYRLLQPAITAHELLINLTLSAGPRPHEVRDGEDQHIKFMSTALMPAHQLFGSLPDHAGSTGIAPYVIALGKLKKTEADEILDFNDIFIWLCGLLQQESREDMVKAIQRLKTPHPTIYSIAMAALNHQLNKPLDENDFKKIAINAKRLLV